MGLSFNVRIRCFLVFAGRGIESSPGERGIALSRPSSVSQEYKAALRTDSYAELWSKVQSQLAGSTSTAVDLLSLWSSSRDRFVAHHHLSETLLEPDQITLAAMVESLHIHHLLVDYFKTSSDACDVCELLLVSIHQTRANFRQIRRVVQLAGTAYECSSSEMISRELGAFWSLGNPLSVISPVQFHDMNESYTVLLRGLTRKCERVRAKARLRRFGEQAGTCCLVLSCGVMGIASIVLAVHGAIGVVAAPGLVSSCFGLGFFSKKKEKLTDPEPSPSSSCRNCKRLRNSKARRSRRLSSQLDVAAKGLYILINDMDTMGSLVGRLQNEAEHAREWADMGAKSTKSDGILREVVRELDLNSLCFMEQLEELEEHIYLCLLTINKSRMSLLQEITVSSSRHEDGGSNNNNVHGRGCGDSD